MNFPLAEAYAFRQMQTTLMIHEYMFGGLFQLSPLPLFGPEQQVPMEFPLFQWLAAPGGSLVGASPQIAGRLAALFFSLICAALVALIGTRVYSRATGFVGFTLFLFLPFGWQWGNAPLIEFAAVAGALACLYLTLIWFERRSWWLIAGSSLSMTVLFLVKITTAVVWVVPLLVIAVFWKNRRESFEPLGRWPLAIPFIVGGLAGLIWTRFSDSYKEEQQSTQFLTSDSLRTWNFGTVDQRLDTKGWSFIFQYGESIYGLLVVFLLLAALGVAFWRNRMVTLSVAATLFIGPLFFFNLYYMDSYYLAAIYPAILLVLAAGISGVCSVLTDKSARVSVMGVGVIGVLVLAWVSPEGQLVSQRSSEGLYQFPLATELIENTPSDAGIITVGCDWDPAYFYLSGRRGLMLSGRNSDESIPVDWIGSDLQYIATCQEDFDPKAATGVNFPLVQVSPHVWRIVPR
jgi:4-amino-4-deoxy-L-arabinose transferase-like glycosyltransferase